MCFQKFQERKALLAPKEQLIITAVDFRSTTKEYDTGVVHTTMTLIIDFGAPQKTSNTVEMFPLAGDIAKVSYFKINDNSGEVMTRSCL